MSDIKVGQVVKNRRLSGTTGKVVALKTGWNGRHQYTKLAVEVGGDSKPKLWAISSCSVVEDELPRCLVTLNNIIKVAQPHMSRILEAQCRSFEAGSTLMQATEYILEDACVSGHINTVLEFQNMDVNVYGRVVLFLQAEFSMERLDPADGGGIDHLLHELFMLYSRRKEH